MNRNRKNDPPDAAPPPAFFAVDFFCGAGGMTCGIIAAGGYVLAGIDRDTQAIATYVNNNVNQPLHPELDHFHPCFVAADLYPETPDYPDGQQQQVQCLLTGMIGSARLLRPDLPLMFTIEAPANPSTGSRSGSSPRNPSSNAATTAPCCTRRFPSSTSSAPK